MERAEHWVLKERNAKLERMHVFLKECERDSADARDAAAEAKRAAAAWQRAAEQAWTHQRRTAERELMRLQSGGKRRAFVMWKTLVRNETLTGRYQRVAERVVRETLLKLKFSAARRMYVAWRRVARDEAMARNRVNRCIIMSGRLGQAADAEEQSRRLQLFADVTFRVRSREWKMRCFLNWREGKRVRLMRVETTQQVGPGRYCPPRHRHAFQTLPS